MGGGSFADRDHPLTLERCTAYHCSCSTLAAKTQVTTHRRLFSGKVARTKTLYVQL